MSPAPLDPPDATLSIKITRATIENLSTGCWEWQRSKCSAGYGMMWWQGKTTRAHTLAYQEYVGPIPEGLELDHLCRNRACCNPAHLEAVTHRENVRRGASPAGGNARKDRCPRGHEYEWYRNGRRCRACNREYAAAKRAEQAVAS